MFWNMLGRFSVTYSLLNKLLDRFEAKGNLKKYFTHA